jgi:hypothetical protein
LGRLEPELALRRYVFLVINGLIYLTYGFVTGRFRDKLLPIRPAEVLQTVADTPHFKIAHEDITVYNAVRKLLYIIVILDRHLEARSVLRSGLTAGRSACYSPEPRPGKARAARSCSVRSTFRPDAVPDAAILGDHRPLIRSLERRGLIRSSLSLGALVMLTGCVVKRPEAAESALLAISRFNDGVQALLFDPNKLAPTYPASTILRQPKFNAYYDVMDVKPVNGETWRLDVSGLVADKRPWALHNLRTLPQTSMVIKHICVEGWSYISGWAGPTLRSFLERVGADLRTKYVAFKRADYYPSSIDMATALPPQTLLATRYGGDTLADTGRKRASHGLRAYESRSSDRHCDCIVRSVGDCEGRPCAEQHARGYATTDWIEPGAIHRDAVPAAGARGRSPWYGRSPSRRESGCPRPCSSSCSRPRWSDHSRRGIRRILGLRRSTDRCAGRRHGSAWPRHGNRCLHA